METFTRTKIQKRGNEKQNIEAENLSTEIRQQRRHQTRDRPIWISLGPYDNDLTDPSLQSSPMADTPILVFLEPIFGAAPSIYII